MVTFIMGSRELYDFVDDNPDVEFHPVDYVNSPLIIAKNDRMISINSCLEVDLQGQVASETIGIRQYSGIGGQVDFIRGASLAREGKAIIAMPQGAHLAASCRGSYSYCPSRLPSCPYRRI